MRVIKPHISIINKGDFNPEKITAFIENCGRICYQSESKGEPEKFIKGCLNRGHESLIEHQTITFDIITDRGVLQEIARHRIGCSPTVESTRYVDYSKEDMVFIEPIFPTQTTDTVDVVTLRKTWFEACEDAESSYRKMLRSGAQKQLARQVSNESLRVRMRMTMNLRSLRHFLGLRCAPGAHPHMKQICIPFLLYLNEVLPAFFTAVRMEEYSNDNSEIRYDGIFADKYLKNWREYIDVINIEDLLGDHNE